jgi:ubiquinone/menaquinone biosynthesis C-methylase UbiE
MPAWTTPARLETVRDLGATAESARRSLDELAAANRFCRGTQSIVLNLTALAAPLPPGELRILDVGSGGGDIARALAVWGRKVGRPLRIVALDRHVEAVARAAVLSRGLTEVQHVRGDAFVLPFRPGSFDFVISSMMLHYFPLGDAKRLLSAFAHVAKRAVLVADIERHWFPCLAIDMLAPLTGNRLIRRHFRNTVLQGFTPAELDGLTFGAGFMRSRIRRYFPYRMVLIGELGQGS